MKKADVHIGAVYRVRVSGNLCDVQILRESPYGGWEGINKATRREVRIKSAQRLCFLVRPAPAETVLSAKTVQAVARHQLAALAVANGSPFPPTGSN